MIEYTVISILLRTERLVPVDEVVRQIIAHSACTHNRPFTARHYKFASAAAIS
jgi:hypothetical protein